MASEPVKGLLGLAGVCAVAWSYTGSVWIIQALLARHGYLFSAWHIAGYLAAYNVCCRQVPAEIARNRVQKLLQLADPGHDAFLELVGHTYGQAALVTITYLIVRAL